jgi:GTP cyclohydrolase IA
MKAASELDQEKAEPAGLRPTLRLLLPEVSIDHEAAQTAVTELLISLGFDVTDEGLVDTPRRVASALAEMVTPVPFKLTTFANNEGYDELVLARSIPFHSLCQHHLLPFIGVAHVGYLPADRLLGLSKLARAVEYFSRGLQVQERLTAQIANCLNDGLKPKGVGVVLEAEHMCMALRGVQKRGSDTVTSTLLGAIRDDARARQEFLSLTAVSRPPA